MASNQTQNYGLSQWELTDDVRMADFNSDNAKIDAALAGMTKFVTGTYVGSGEYGSETPTSLTLDFPPQFILIWGYYSQLLMGIRGQKVKMIGSSTSYLYPAVWDGNTVTWYSTHSEQAQMNDLDRTYYYIAIG